jgi:hypothetical protein
MNKILDVERCIRAMKDLNIKGVASSSLREKVITDAIKQIQEDGSTALLKKYIGVKNYAEFGDQRYDDLYGYSPRHGDIVFSVGRTDSARKTILNENNTTEENKSDIILGSDHIYLLEAARDWKNWEEIHTSRYTNTKTIVKISLCDAITEYERLKSRISQVELMLTSATVDSHE